jgi:hypothetical protein
MEEVEVKPTSDAKGGENFKELAVGVHGGKHSKRKILRLRHVVGQPVGVEGGGRE